MTSNPKTSTKAPDSAWTRERSFTSGNVRCELSSMPGKRGRLWSYCVSKVKPDGVLTKFFHPVDSEDIVIVIEDMEDYLKEKAGPQDDNVQP